MRTPPGSRTTLKRGRFGLPLLVSLRDGSRLGLLRYPVRLTNSRMKKRVETRLTILMEPWPRPTQMPRLVTPSGTSWGKKTRMDWPWSTVTLTAGAMPVLWPLPK